MTEQPATCGRCGASLAPAEDLCLNCGLVRAKAMPTPIDLDDVPRAPAPKKGNEEGAALASSLDERSDPEAETRKVSSGGNAADLASKGLGEESTETGGDKSDDAKFKTGDVLLGHYTIVKQLGRGGMGTVYLASDELSGQKVAVKVLPAALARERDIRERFVQEARALATMDHPNIVPLITFAQEGEDRFLVMKFVDGEALDTMIRRLGVMSPEHARKVVRAVLSALGYAHARGIVHRDVKPSNVLIEGDLDGEHRVFLVDFGIAKKDDGNKQRLTQTGMLMGTPQYMSPEQIGGQPVDGRSDLYAAGLVLFEMLAGRPPFDGQKTFQVLRAHVEQPVPDVREARGGYLPDDIVAIVYLLLRKDPKNRPGDAAQAMMLLDGTGSFPALTAEEQRRTPYPATRGPLPFFESGSRGTPPTNSVPMPQPSGGFMEPPKTFAADGRLDDPSMDELAVIRPNWFRRIAALMFLGGLVAGAWWVTRYRPDLVERAVALLQAQTASVDAGPAPPPTTVKDDVQQSMLLATARLQLEKKDYDRARIAVDAVLENEPDNIKALSLRVDILIAGGALDEADKTLAKLKLELQKQPAADEELRKHLDVQQEQLDKKQDAKHAEDAAARAKEAERERQRRRPALLAAAAYNEVTSATKRDVSACYSKHVQATNPKARGDVTLHITVQPTGTVTSANVTKASKDFKSQRLAKCLEDQVMKWKFKPFPGGADSINHTFRFAPSGG